MSKLKKILESFTGADNLRAEKSRLEAFLAAMPGEYCGFSNDGDIIYSEHIPKIFNISQIKKIEDITGALGLNDVTAFERAISALQDEATDFAMDIYLAETDRHIHLSGTRGTALNRADYFNILWVNDVTDQTRTLRQIEDKTSAAKDSLNRLKMVLDAIPSPYWLRDKDTHIIWVNKAYALLVNSAPSTILADQVEIFIKPKDKNEAFKTAKDIATYAIQKSKAKDVQGYVVTQGKRLFAQITEMPLEENTYILGSFRDLTEFEKTNTTYTRHLSANESLLENLRTAVAIYNAEHELEFYNSAFAQLWDLDDSYLNGRPKLGDILEKLRESRRLPEEADFRRYKQSWIDMFTRLIDPHDDMLYLPDGSALRMLIMPHPVGGLMMTFEDVSSRLELESSYNTLIAVQRETLDNLAEGVAVFGSDGRLRLYNPSYAKLWQLNPEDLEGNPHITKVVERMVGSFDTDKFEAPKEKLVAHGIERYAQEGRLSLSEQKLLEYTTVPLPDGGVLVSYFDVTNSVKVENALRERNAALEAAEKLKTDFLANVSYQLRTPLNAIIGFAEILDNEYFGALNEKQKEYSLGIEEAGGKLVHLIDDILDLSTIEAGYLELAYDQFNLYSMMSDLYALTKEWALTQKIDVTLDCDKEIGGLVADERRIKQILLNLMRNAINFTPEKGAITLSAHTDEAHVIFKVADTGIGISAADQKRIFEPFERAVHEHRADMSPQALSRGAGLGLTLVKNIVDLHGGEIAIESDVGQGTTITIQIPKEADMAGNFLVG